MNIKITNKNGATLKTANKYVKEDIAITIDESLLGSGGGTAVPSSGTVEKVYINKSLNANELYDLLSSLEYVDGTNIGYAGYNLCFVFGNADFSKGLYIWDTDNSYDVLYFENGVNNNVLQVTYDKEIRWYDNIGDFITFNENNVLGSLGVSLGLIDCNEKLKNLFSITPFGGSCEPTGLPLEVSELPVTGNPTAVPNSGYVENVYVNTEMPPEEVVEIIENFYANNLNKDILFAFAYNSTEVTVFKRLYFSRSKSSNNTGTVETSYYIRYQPSLVANGPETYLFSYTTYTSGATPTGGWNTDFNGVIEINSNVLSEHVPNITGDGPIGSNNDMLVNLFSVIPSTDDVPFNPEAFYKLAFPASQVWLNMGTETVNLMEFATQMGVTVILETVDSYPENPVEFGNSDEMVFYYISSENDIYFYAAMDATGPQWLPFTLFVELMLEIPGLTFQGKVSSPDDFSGDGYYLVDGYTYKFYKYNSSISDFEEAVVGGVKPAGVLEVTTNHEFYDVTNYAEVYVTVPEPSGTIEITSNGTHDVKDYYRATVNVPDSGFPKTLSEQPFIKENIPRSGKIHKVYFNMSLTPSEVIKLHDNNSLASNYQILCSNDFYKRITFTKTTDGSGKYYEIRYYKTPTEWTELFSYHTSGSLMGSNFIGWNPSFNGVIEVDATITGALEGTNIGDKNYYLLSLVWKQYVSYNESLNYKNGAIYKVDGINEYYLYNSTYTEFDILK